MIGQTKLLETLDKYTLETLPKTILLLGEEGAGKHTIAKYLANKMQLDAIEINESITNDDLTDYQQSPVAKFYIINLNNFIDKQQNQFLKFIEEPSDSVYIILLANSEIGILPTVLNRCIKFHLDPYTVDELRSVSWFSESLPPEVFKICTTPGQVKNAESGNIKKLYELCSKIIKYATQLSYTNLLAIVPSINFNAKESENNNKYDFDLFFKALELTASNDYIKTGSEISFKIYTFTNKFRQQLIGKLIAKENFMINFLTNLWEYLN